MIRHREDASAIAGGCGGTRWRNKGRTAASQSDGLRIFAQLIAASRQKSFFLRDIQKLNEKRKPRSHLINTRSGVGKMKNR
jgi:hypothetical protein